MGLVSEAAGGTLILDRVDQLSKEGQRVLLRIVEGKLRPVGSAEERPVDLRIIATCRSATGLSSAAARPTSKPLTRKWTLLPNFEAWPVR